MGKKNSGIMLVVALVLAGIGTLLVMNVLNSKEAEIERLKKANTGGTQQAVNKISVVRVSAEKIAAQTELKRDDLYIDEVPEESLPNDAVRVIEETAGLYTRVELNKDDILRRVKITSKEEALGLNYRVPKGNRAVTFTITEATGVGFAVNAGDRVDVIAVAELVDKKSNEQQDIARTILQNVLVLESSTDPNQAEKRSTQPSITVAVTPEQAEVVALVAKKGQLVATLRPVQDEGTFPADMITWVNVMGEKKEEEKPVAPEPEKPKIRIMTPGGGSQAIELNR